MLPNVDILKSYIGCKSIFHGYAQNLMSSWSTVDNYLISDRRISSSKKQPFVGDIGTVEFWYSALRS